MIYMTQAQLELFYNSMMAVCAVMALIMIARSKKRGVSAFFMSGGYLALGALLFGLRSHWPNAIIIILGILVATMLISDFLIRLSQGEPSP